jgi:hypothetical protein
MVRSLVLFTHIVGMLLLSAALALEWAQGLGLRSTTLRQPPQGALHVRIFPVAGILILLSGGYLATAAGLWSFGFVWASLIAIVAMSIAGRFEGAAWLYGRTTVFLGIVYLMIAKPDLTASVLILLVAAIVGWAASLGWPRPAPAPTRS